MNLHQLDQVLEHLDKALALTTEDYQATGDPSMQMDMVTLKVVLSKMQKRRAEAFTDYVHNGFQQ